MCIVLNTNDGNIMLDGTARGFNLFEVTPDREATGSPTLRISTGPKKVFGPLGFTI